MNTTQNGCVSIWDTFWHSLRSSTFFDLDFIQDSFICNTVFILTSKRKGNKNILPSSFYACFWNFLMRIYSAIATDNAMCIMCYLTNVGVFFPVYDRSYNGGENVTQYGWLCESDITVLMSCARWKCVYIMDRGVSVLFYLCVETGFEGWLDERFICERSFETCVCLRQSLLVLRWPCAVDRTLNSSY